MGKQQSAEPSSRRLVLVRSKRVKPGASALARARKHVRYHLALGGPGASQLPRRRWFGSLKMRSDSRYRSRGTTRGIGGHRHATRSASSACAYDRRRLRRGAGVASLVGALLALVAPCVGTADAASLPLGPSTTVALPANAFFGPFRFPGPHVFGQLSSVACPPLGSCVAVGAYASAETSGDAMVVSESGGVWNQALEVAPPSSPALHVEAGLDSAACPLAGSCVAIGQYLSSSQEQQAMVVSESGGVWGRAIEIPGVSLESVACRAPGSCVAIGTARPGSTQIVGVIESGGVWGKPQRIALPVNGAPEYIVELAPLSCQVSGPCVTVGSYTDVSHQQRGLGLSESNGVWAPASEITSTPDSEADVRLYFVACPASGSCVADGLGSGGLAIGVSESNGKWAEARPITPPSDPLAKLTTLFSVACPVSGQCFAVGYDETPSSTNAVVVGASGGVWGQAIELIPNASLRRVACSGTDSCVALGSWSGSGSARAIAVTETHGEWGQASEIAAPPNAPNSQTGYGGLLELLACPASGFCAALGNYQDESGNTRLMAAGTTTFPPGTPKGATAHVSLVSSAIAVQRNGWALVKLSCAGTAKCAGNLKLTAKTRARKKRQPAKAKVIATSNFTVAANATATIKLKLDAAGRALLNAAHGRLSATLTILKSSPAPSQKETKSIRLTQRR